MADTCRGCGDERPQGPTGSWWSVVSSPGPFTDQRQLILLCPSCLPLTFAVYCAGCTNEVERGAERCSRCHRQVDRK